MKPLAGGTGQGRKIAAGVGSHEAGPLGERPLREIGKYGGTWRHGLTGLADTSAGPRVNESDHLTYFDDTATKVVPNIAKDWEVTDNGRTVTLGSGAL